MSLSVFYYCICAFLCIAVAISTYLCIICRHFCCPMSLFQGHVAGWNFSQNRASLMFEELGKGGSHR